MAETAAPVKIKLQLKIGIRPNSLYAAAVGFFVIDRLLKSTVLSLDGARGWRGIAEFTLFKNTGIAFSLPLPNAAFWPLAALALGVVSYFLIRSCSRGDKSTAAALTLIVLGAASNMFDRYLYGATIDYLLFFGVSAINLADILIVSGTALLLLIGHRQPRPAASSV